MTQANTNAAWQALPALNISEALIDEGMDILEECFKSVTK